MVIMTTSEDYRLYLETRFDSLTTSMNGQFEEIHDRLDKIEIQTSRTNGNVTHLEKEIEEQEKELIKHASSCPKGKEIQDIHDAMIKEVGKEEVKIKLGTHKQVTFNNILSIIGTLLVLIGLIISVITSKRADNNLKRQIDNLGTPVIVNPRGITNPFPAKDSLELKFYRDGEFKDGIRDTQ